PPDTRSLHDALPIYDVIGNLDADVSFGPDYFEYLLEKFASDPQLGVAGTHYVEGEFHSFRDSYINVRHVNGQCQLFRRECFDDIDRKSTRLNSSHVK